ncbi:CheY-like chemotaxis protein [Phyllobacterium ifriqiyense]
MSDSCQVLVVAPDYGLRRSLEFALEVEGFAVLAFESLAAALASTRVAEGRCIIMDEEAISNDPSAPAMLRIIREPILLLVDGAGPVSTTPGVRVLRKPILGNALIMAVRSAGKTMST